MKMMIKSLLSALLLASIAAVLVSTVVTGGKLRRRLMWEHKTLLDAGNVKAGSLPEGEPVKCLEISSTAVYRYEKGVLRLYPNQFIAQMHDVDYDTEIVYYKDCSRMGFKFGEPMPFYMKEGRNVVCNKLKPTIFRWTGGKLHPYPNMLTKESYDRVWDNLVGCDCDKYGLEFGEPMELYKPADGDLICCLEDMALYVWEGGKLGGKLDHIANSPTANKSDSDWRHHAVWRHCEAYDKGPEIDYTVSKD